MNEQTLRKIYRDILLGYSSDYLDDKLVYVKHFDNFDQGIVDCKYLELYYRASIDLITEKEKLSELEKSGDWTPADDNWVLEWRDYVERLRKTRDHPLNTSMREATIKSIEVEQAKIDDKLNKKAKLLGVTAESWASRRVNEFYIFLSLYKDTELSEGYLSEEDFEDLEENELEKIVLFYNKIMNELNDSIKKVALSSSFQNSFSLCDDSIYNFYGKPISRLTYHQSELAIYGRYFKNILSEGNIPSNIKNDPEALINWHNGDKNIIAPVQTEQVLDNLNKEAVKTGGKIKGNLNVMKAMQGLLK